MQVAGPTSINRMIVQIVNVATVQSTSFPVIAIKSNHWSTTKKHPFQSVLSLKENNYEKDPYYTSCAWNFYQYDVDCTPQE
jgi:hypothetical protein